MVIVGCTVDDIVVDYVGDEIVDGGVDVNVIVSVGVVDAGVGLFSSFFVNYIVVDGPDDEGVDSNTSLSNI